MRVFALVALCLFCWFKAYSQEYRFDNITVENGLSQSQVLAIYQDPLGELWIGTASGGITVFDGSRFRYLSMKDGLPSNTIYDIAALDSGYMAVATFEGLAILDRKGGVEILNSENGLPDDLVYRIFKDSKNRTWLATGKGFAFLEGRKVVSPGKNPLEGLSVFNIQEDEDGGIWISTLGSGVFWYDGQDYRNFTTANGLPSNDVTCIIDQLSRKLICTYSGVVKFVSDSIAGTPEDIAYASEVVFDALADRSGKYWFGTNRGLYVINGDQQLLTTSDGLVGRAIWRVIQDREGNIWCASQEQGVSKISPRVFSGLQHEAELKDNAVNRITGMPAGEVWLATDNGVAIIHPDQSVDYLGIRSGLNHKVVRCIYRDKEGYNWIGTPNGLTRWKDKRYVKYRDANDKLNFVQDLCEYRDTLLLATSQGLARLKGRKIVPHDLPDLPRTVINQIITDKQGMLWIATNEQGLFRYDGTRMRKFGDSEGFTAKMVKSVYCDEQGRIWCSTNSGLYSFSGSHFSNYTTENGLVSNAVTSVIQMNDSTFWVGLSKGANRIVLRNDTIAQVQAFGSQHGFAGQETNPRAIYLGNDGKVWFGTNGGVNIYHPDRDQPHLLEPLTRIDEVRLFMQKTDWSLHDTQLNELGLPTGLELPYDKNNLSFQYKAVTHVSPELVRYKYRLVGEDPDWVETDSRSADYSNLGPGEYTFEVLACNSDGVWNKKPATFSFSINPPFWKTGWFYAGILLLVLGAVLSYFKIRSANRKITQINDVLKEQSEIISKKNKDIMDSIHYAKRIQDAVLPPAEKIDLPKTFIFSRPKDVVSGDFYWYYQKGELSLFAVADCTGHGVPGAFMSIIGYNLLNKIVGEYHVYKPAEILARLNEEIAITLNRSESEDRPVRDGMDIAICCFNKNTEKIEFAGAFHPFYLWRNGELDIIKGDRIPLGITHNGYSFNNHEVQLEKGDIIYLFSDGFVDQFGGSKGKKYKSVNFRALLTKLGHMSLDQQRNALIREFENWKGQQEQIDDVLILGTQL